MVHMNRKTTSKKKVDLLAQFGWEVIKEKSTNEVNIEFQEILVDTL